MGVERNIFLPRSFFEVSCKITEPDSIIKIADFDDVNDAVILKNISDSEIDLDGWEIVAVEDVYAQVC